MFIRHQGVVIQIISLHINEKAFMKAVFVSAFAPVFLKYLCSDAFMPGKCVNKNRRREKSSQHKEKLRLPDVA